MAQGATPYHDGDRGLVAIATIALILWSLVMLWLALAAGPRHDYVAYLKQWALVLNGADPWSTDNTYGPLHNVLAYVLPYGKLAPKIVIVVCLLAANALLAMELVRARGVTVLYRLYLLLIPTNFLIFVIGAVYALNDAWCAALIVAAVLARHKEQFIIAGVFLGLAVLLKYYPAVLLVLFALDGGKFRWRLTVAGVVVAAVGLALGSLVWGFGWFDAVAFGTERGPKLLSIVSSLNAHPWLVGGKKVVGVIVGINTAMVVLVAAASVLVAWRARLHWLEASVLALLSIYAVYKVGHQQFYVPWLFLVAALPLAPTETARRLGWLMLPFALFLSVFQWGYTYTAKQYNDEFEVIRDNIGFFATPFALLSVAAYFVPGTQSLLARRLAAPADTPAA